MFNEINIGTVIISIFTSLVTAHIITNLKINKFINLVDQQGKNLMNELKNQTIEILKKQVK